ncbi:MAG: 4-(cytidine 5'-diphospho)-2-C-methyl-D-erythritol kinase, partial [bacterium]
MSLEILGRRSDGFHELITVLQTLDYSDELSFEIPSDEINLSIAGRDVARGKDNLICAAALLIKEQCRVDQGVRISLKKHIPVGAGLGGGSSNAAVTLIALNQLWNCQLTRSDLVQLASRLGSDVPFFLNGGTGLGWGRGEQICSLPEMAREFSVLVYYPRFQVSAAEAYSKIGDLSDRLTRPDLDTTIRRFHEVLEAGDWSILRNDLEEAVFS